MPLGRSITPGLVFTVDLSKLADDNRENPRTIQAPFGETSGGHPEPMIIDWGDGSNPEIVSSDGWPAHTYEVSGNVFTVTVRTTTGKFPVIRFCNSTNSTSGENPPTYNITWAVVAIDHFYGEYQKQTNFAACLKETKNLKFVSPGLLYAPNASSLNYYMMRSGISQPLESLTLAFNTRLSSYGTNYVFYGCSGLTGSIPGYLLPRGTSHTGCASLFANCTGLTGSIPTDLFRYNTAVTTFANCFNSCSGLTGSIPADLFKYNTAVISFSGCFAACSSLTGSIPADLFKYNTSVTTFASCFQVCSGLTGSIPADLFKYNTSVTGMGYTFAGCSGLTGDMPSDLFDNNTGITNVGNAFKNCTGLTAPYEFWNKSYAATISTTENCYTGCSGMNLSQIPSAYGGLGA